MFWRKSAQKILDEDTGTWHKDLFFMKIQALLQVLVLKCWMVDSMNKTSSSFTLSLTYP